jgi:hypothetical protein|tara:strand:+ start:1206 stop:1664 length:459 start_codon:yes stop_codon:yes gene_type:complete
MTRSTTGRRSRQKGQEYERRIASMLEDALPGTTWKRRTQTRGARVDGSDIEGLDGDGKPLPLFLELHCGKLPIDSKLDQAIMDAPPGWHPIAIVHRPGTQYRNDRARLTVGDFLELAGLSDCTEDLNYTMRVGVSLDSLLTLLGGWWRRRTG